MNHATSSRAFGFDAAGSTLVGIVSTPKPIAGTPSASTGMLILVGGPQYRVGSHRQFVLLARSVAAGGVPVMRFDFAGMGDSAGPVAAFTDRGVDIRAAIDAFMAAVPGLTGVALWGLCDGASAAMLYAPTDARVKRLMLVNPWVRSAEGLARTHLKHHYLRMLSRLDFWRRLFRGGIDVRRSAMELASTLMRSRARGAAAANDSFQTRMAQGWKGFAGDILLICSGDDLTAREFEEHAASDAAWSGLLGQARVTRRLLNDADHTFSSVAWRDQVAAWSLAWLVGVDFASREVAEPSRRSNEIA